VIRSWLAGSVLAILAIPVFAQPAGEVYAPKDGRFSAKFPGKPKETTQTAKSPLGDLKVFTATYATADGNIFMVSYNDFPEGAAKPDARDTLYDGVRDGLKGKDGRFIAEKAIEVGPDKLPGREIELEKDKKRLRFRVVLRDGRLYQAAAVGTSAFAAGKDATGFLDSFELK
jgi:hypothetical protein